MKVNTQQPAGTSAQRISKNEAMDRKADRSADQPSGGKAGKSVEISDQGKMMSQAQQVAQSVPDIREDKVSRLRDQVLGGTYRVDSREVAERVLDEHLHSDFGKNNL